METKLGKKIWNKYPKISRESITVLGVESEEGKKKNLNYISMQAQNYMKLKDDDKHITYDDDDKDVTNFNAQGYYLVCAKWMREWKNWIHDQDQAPPGIIDNRALKNSIL